MSDTITFKIDLKVYLPIQNPLQYLMDPLNLFDNVIQTIKFMFEADAQKKFKVNLKNN